MTLTHLDLDRIEGLAKAATPGPWHLWRKASQRVEDDRGLYVAETGPYDEKGHTAAYIVAAQPSTVLALITLIRELEGALTEIASHNFVRLEKEKGRTLDETAASRLYNEWHAVLNIARTALKRKTP